MRDDNLAPRARVQTMQIIGMALFLGQASFLGIALYLVFGQNEGQGMNRDVGMPVLSYVAALFGVSNILLAGVMVGMIQRNGLKNLARESPEPARDIDRLLMVKQTSLLVGQALLEGTGFLGIMAFMVEGQTAILFIVGVAMLLLLASIPNQGRVQTWMERQLSVLEEQRARPEN